MIEIVVNTKKAYIPIIVFSIFLFACTIQFSDIEELVIGTPTPVPTNTPEGDVLILTTNTFRINLAPSEQVPGTGLQYVGPTDGGGVSVLINGLPANRKALDSFNWKGGIAPFVVGDYRLRITDIIQGNLGATGSVTISVLNPVPVELDLSTTPPPSDLNYPRLDIDYRIPVGGRIPGTTVTYMGLNDELSSGELQGFSQYPFINQGDSFTWVGTVRDNVHLKYDLRAVSVTESELRLIGGLGVPTAEGGELWVYP